MTFCDECGYAKDTWKEEGALENGLRFNPKEMGYYGGFTDSNPWEEAQDQDVVLLCHDCSLRLMRAFPSVARAMGADAGHPCDKEKACCEFAWKFDEELRVLRGTRVGTWELREGQ